MIPRRTSRASGLRHCLAWWIASLIKPIFQITPSTSRDHSELIEAHLQIVDDLLSEDIGLGKVFGVFEALVL